jgi:hypothetical protein
MLGVSMRLYKDEECLKCGGKGYIRDGEDEYTVLVFLNNHQVQKVFTLARGGAEAMAIAAEMFSEAYGLSLRAGDVLTLEVEERR